VSRPSRRRRDPALLRARYRTLFFLLLTILAPALGHWVALVPALLGVFAGLVSVRIATNRGSDLMHTFVVLDWLLLGCVLALSGGADSWLLGAVPLLALGQLAGAPRREWPYLLVPALLLLVVLAIADPTLGGDRAAGVAKVAVLVTGGGVAAIRLKRRPVRPARAPRVDAATGLSTGACLAGFLESATQTALADHAPLSVVFVRLQHFADSRDFLGPERSEQLVRGVARRAERRLGRDGRAFRIRSDSLVLVLPGSSLAEARQAAADLAHDVSGGLIAGRRQTLAVGAASFPTVRRLDDLLAAARDEALPSASGARPDRPALPLAAAQ
jgi:GGDEF domain-containing protein